MVYDKQSLIFVKYYKMRTITYLFLIFTSITFSQSNVTAFQAGEKLTFTASYNMSGLLTDLAEITCKQVK